MTWRRKRLPPAMEDASAAFLAVLAEIEPSKAALTEVMPTTRMPGRPFPDALSELEDHLERAASLMPAWRRDEVEDVWRACDAGLAQARSTARRFREDAPELGGFEGVIGAVEELLTPLEPFREGAERFRRLRTRRT